MFGWTRGSGGKIGEVAPEESLAEPVSIPSAVENFQKAETEGGLSGSGAQMPYESLNDTGDNGEGSGTREVGNREEVEGRGEGVDEEGKPGRMRIDVHIPERYLIMPSLCAIMGMSLGLMRGARQEGMRFLAENAHRPPRTVEGWYFYKKTKNYRMMWGGLRAGGRDAIRLGSVGLTWAAREDGIERIGKEDFRGSGYVREFREVGAGLGTAAVFSTVCKSLCFPSWPTGWVLTG